MGLCREYVVKSPPHPHLILHFGRWGNTMIGALQLKQIKMEGSEHCVCVHIIDMSAKLEFTAGARV